MQKRNKEDVPILTHPHLIEVFPLLPSLSRRRRVEGGEEEWGDSYTQGSHPVLGYVTPSGLIQNLRGW